MARFFTNKALQFVLLTLALLTQLASLPAEAQIGPVIPPIGPIGPANPVGPIGSPPSLAPCYEWANHFGGTRNADEGAAYSIKTDAANNSYVAGLFSGSISFGATTLTALSSEGFVAKLDHAGTPLWVKRFGGPNGAAAQGVAVDASGNVIITGRMYEHNSFDGTPVTQAGRDDIILAKYNPSGTLLWVKTLGGIGYDRGKSVAVDASGNIIVSGYIQTTVDFGGGPLTSAGGGDAFVAKFDPAGAHLWSKRFGSTDNDAVESVVIDGNGNVLITGSVSGTMNAGGSTLTAAAGYQDVFVVKFNSSGVHQWSQGFGSEGVRGTSIATDGANNVLVTGSFSGTVNFGGSRLISGNYPDVFLTKFSPAGAHLWSNRFGGTSVDRGQGVTTDASGNVFLTGVFDTDINLGGGTRSGSNGDIFLAKYNASGTYLWDRTFGGSGDDEGTSVAVNANTVFLTGNFTGTANFGGGPVTANNNDAFVVRFNDMTVGITAAPSLTGTSGQSVTLTGTGGSTYNWSTSAFGSTTTTPALSVSVAGTYYVDGITGSCYSTTSVVVSFTVPCGSSKPTLNASSSVVCEGSAVQVVATLGGAVASLQWYKDGQPTGLTSATLNLNNSQAAQSGRYALVVTGGAGLPASCGTVTSAPFVLTVNPLPTVTILVPGNASVQGATITLPSPLMGVNFRVLGGTTFERFMVIDRTNGYELRQVDTNADGVFSVNRTGPFRLTVTDANRCQRTVEGMIVTRP